MKYHFVALCLLFGTGFSLVSAHNADEAPEKAPLDIKPTEAPLMMSTAKPTAAPRPTSPPTKPIIIINKPPHLTEKQTGTHAVAKSNDAEHLKAAGETAVKIENKTSNVEPTSGKPLQVAGFITKNGNIYEIEGKPGVGLIQGRQSPDEQSQMNVCNYGTVVIYSDLPCDQVANVHVGDVQQHYQQPQKPQQTVVQEPVPAQTAAPEVNILETNDNKQGALNDTEREDEVNKPRDQKKKRKNKKRRKGNRGRPQKKRKSKRGNKKRRSQKRRQPSRRRKGQRKPNRRRQPQKRRRRGQQNGNRRPVRRNQNSNRPRKNYRNQFNQQQFFQDDRYDQDYDNSRGY